MKRRDSNWWPVSSATARKLRRKGVYCRWSTQFDSLVRWNPLFKETPIADRPSLARVIKGERG